MGRPAGWMQKLTGRGAMRSPGAPSLRSEIEQLFWKQIATGITSEKAAEAVGVSSAVGTRWFRHRGGMPLFMSNHISGRYLSFAERVMKADGFKMIQINLPPPPSWDWLNLKHVLIAEIMAARGCPDFLQAPR